MLNDVNGLGLKLWRLCLESDFHGEYGEFKNYFLALFSYKFLSEKLVFKLDYELRRDNLSFVEAYNLEEYRDDLRDEALESLGFFIEPDFLFSNFVRLACIGDVNLLRKLESAFIMFSDCSYYGVCPLSFMNLFEDVDLQSDTLGKTEEDRTDFISELLIHLSFFDFPISNEDDCIVGDVFDYLLSQFAFESNSIGCYALLEVNMVLSKIVSLNKHVLDSVYDSCSGLSSSLLSVKKEVLVNNFYGEEINQTYFNIARMNMLIHNVKCEDFNLVCGDCLNHPGFACVKFDAIVSNLISYSHWSGDRKFLNDERFKDYGRVPSKTLSNFALLLHMLYYLKDDGTMAIVMGIGFQFKVWGRYLREYLIKDKNYLDAVINLPGNLFPDTISPTCILVLKKSRMKNQSVLLIDASHGFNTVNGKNRLRKMDINKIVRTYKNREELTYYSHNASFEELKDNDLNLNISRYVEDYYEYMWGKLIDNYSFIN